MAVNQTARVGGSPAGVIHIFLQRLSVLRLVRATELVMGRIINRREEEMLIEIWLVLLGTSVMPWPALPSNVQPLISLDSRPVVSVRPSGVWIPFQP